jgi:hypothetical protein
MSPEEHLAALEQRFGQAEGREMNQHDLRQIVLAFDARDAARAIERANAMAAAAGRRW